MLVMTDKVIGPPAQKKTCPGQAIFTTTQKMLTRSFFGNFLCFHSHSSKFNHSRKRKEKIQNTNHVTILEEGKRFRSTCGAQ
jgi:hypothetical protein